MANVNELTEGNVTPYRTGWRWWLDGSRAPIKFLHIDAEHSYQEVRDNILAALPLMAVGGIICGDDVHHPPVQQAISDTLGVDNIYVEATLWSYTVPTLAAEYDRLCRVPSDIYEHLPTFVEMVRERNAQHVIELGTRTGVSTIAWLYGLQATGGLLTSVDIDERPAIGNHDGWTFIQGDDLDPAITSALEPADIVFIDTSHLYEHTVAELNIYRWLVKPGGLIVCHDTNLERPQGAPARPKFPVRTALEEFAADNGYEAHFVDNCWGLGWVNVT
jgi:predicted O-methyltransferase YrrM